MLSETVANALKYHGDASTTETERFVRTFDKFFDCLNVRNLQEHHHRRKPNLAPYSSSTDERLSVSAFKSFSQRFKVYEIYTHLQWLENDFLGYLKEWKDDVAARDDVTKAQKPRMCLSKETLEGLHITGIVYPQKNSIRPDFYLQ